MRKATTIASQAARLQRIAGPSTSARTTLVPRRSLNTINQSEIEHFSKLSSQWWDTSGEFKLLHRMNPARVEYLRQKMMLAEDVEWTFENRHSIPETGVGRWLEGKRVLDVGCGGGLLSEVGLDMPRFDSEDEKKGVKLMIEPCSPRRQCHWCRRQRI